MTSPQPETVLTAPDGCTKYLLSSIDRHLASEPSGTVIHVQFQDQESRLDLAEWCLTAGLRIHNPFAHYTDLSLLLSAS